MDTSDALHELLRALGGAGKMMESGGGNVGFFGSSGMPGPAPQASMDLAPGAARKAGYAIYLSGDAIGASPDTQGRILMQKFLDALTEIAPPPQAIILVGSAARLAQPGSAALESLSLMQEQGVRILIADASASERGQFAVGESATTHIILMTMLQAEKVISL